MQRSVALLSGEMSGDAVGGHLASAIRRLDPDVAMWGMGSTRMAAAGVELVCDSAAWGAIGVIEALKVYPQIRFRVYPRMLAEIDRRHPDVVVLIDFGAFNIRVAKHCTERGVPVLYYFPPGSWRRSGPVGSGLVKYTSRIATPFPWSADRLRAAGANAEFVGHPLLDMAQPTLSREQFAGKLGLEPKAPIVGLLPGSRSFEIRYNLPAMLGTAEVIHEKRRNAQFVVGLAPNAPRHQVEELLRRTPADRYQRHHQGTPQNPATTELVTPEGLAVPAPRYEDWLEEQRTRFRATGGSGRPPVALAEGMTYEVMAYSDVLLACSGTATLEAALLETPMVIMYRGSRLMEMEYRLRRVKRVEHIGMPNIIAGKRVVPELIQDQATPEALAAHAMEILSDPSVSAQMKAALHTVRQALGAPGASDRVAHMVIAMADDARNQRS